MKSTQPKSYYVLGQNGSIGQLIRCSDAGAAELEFSAMYLSICKRIAKSIRPTTEEKAMQWFDNATTVGRFDSRFNLA